MYPKMTPDFVSSVDRMVARVVAGQYSKVRVYDTFFVQDGAVFYVDPPIHFDIIIVHQQ